MWKPYNNKTTFKHKAECSLGTGKNNYKYEIAEYHTLVYKAEIYSTNLL